MSKVQKLAGDKMFGESFCSYAFALCTWEVLNRSSTTVPTTTIIHLMPKIFWNWSLRLNQTPHEILPSNAWVWRHQKKVIATLINVKRIAWTIRKTMGHCFDCRVFKNCVLVQILRKCGLACQFNYWNKKMTKYTTPGKVTR